MDKKDAAQPEPAADAARPEHPLAQLVDAWFQDHFPGSSVAQSTPAWNHTFAAVAELKRRLIEKVGN